MSRQGWLSKRVLKLSRDRKQRTDPCHLHDASTMSASPSRTSTRLRRSSSGLVSRSRARGRSSRASSWTLSSASLTPAPRLSCCGRPTEAPGWNFPVSSGPTTSPGRRPRWPTSWGCATSLSRLTTSRPPSTGSPWTATGWSAASASTSTSGAWPTCAGRKGSSCPWPSASADALVAIDDPATALRQRQLSVQGHRAMAQLTALAASCRTFQLGGGRLPADSPAPRMLRLGEERVFPVARLSPVWVWVRAADDPLAALPCPRRDLVLNFALLGARDRVVIRFAGDEGAGEGEADGVHRRPRREVDRHGLSEDPVQSQIGKAVPDQRAGALAGVPAAPAPDRKSTRLNSSHLVISYAVFCLKKNKKENIVSEKPRRDARLAYVTT